ncbi:MAG: 4Fe-4S dicluster domain-containing protein [Chloroflexi bacterium]|nr:4Fe-4S dicluster domain-containing protein [Chloroflexota bacterium]
MTEQIGGSADGRRSERLRLGRRSILKWAFIAAASGAMGALAKPVLGAARQSPEDKAHQHTVAQAIGDTEKRVRRWAMIIDLRSCDGCQSVGKPPQCTQACVQGHYAPEPMEWIETYEAELPGGGTQFIPTPCQQCQNSPCTNVCPVGATFHSPEGIVLIDQERCIGCRICMEACPYDRRFFNWGQPTQPPETIFQTYNPENQSPAYKGTVMKCNFCPHMARSGRLPYCAQACPNNAIYYGDLEEDLATNGVQVVQFSRFASYNSSYHLKEDLGTEPRVYYIPGYGQNVGRNPYKKGRKPTVWSWQRSSDGGETWTR